MVHVGRLGTATEAVGDTVEGPHECHEAAESGTEKSHVLKSRSSSAGVSLANARAAIAQATIDPGGNVHQLDGHGKHNGI